MSHGNARTTFHARMLIVQRHRAGVPQAHIARMMGISRGRLAVALDLLTDFKARLTDE